MVEEILKLLKNLKKGSSLSMKVIMLILYQCLQLLNILVIINIVLAVILIIVILLQKSEGGALGLGVSQESFTSSRSVGTFLTKSTAIIATLFIITSIVLVAISHDEIREVQSVIEKEENKDSDLPQLPESSK